MPPPLPVFARRSPDRIVFGDAATPLPMALYGLRSADGHVVTAFARADVRGVDRPADALLFAEQFLAGRASASADDVARHFAAGLTPTAGDFVAARPAAETLSGRDALERVLQQQFDAIAFRCGLDRASPLSVALDCPTLRDEQDRQAARARRSADAEHAAGLAHAISHAADADVPVRTRLAAMPLTPVVLTAGPNLVLWDGDGDVRVVPVPPDVGALRSVRTIAGTRLAVGGVTGVAVVTQTGRTERLLPDGDGAGGRGFNAVACELLPSEASRAGVGPTIGRIAATHGEIGVTVWDGDAPPRRFATPGPARHLIACGNTFLFSAGNAVFALSDGVIRPVDDAAANVVGLLPVDGQCVVVRRDGSLRTLDSPTLSAKADARLDYPVVAAAVLGTPGLSALLVADDRGNIDAVTPDGRPLGRLAARVGDVRMIAAAGGRIFVVTADRITALCLYATGVERPRMMNVVARTGHHVTDLIAV